MHGLSLTHWPVLRDPTSILVADFIRAGILIGCSCLAAASIALLWSWQAPRMSGYQRARFLSFWFSSLFIAASEVGRIHKPVIIWRLPVAVLYLICALYGVWGMRHGMDLFPERRKAPRD